MRRYRLLPVLSQGLRIGRWMPVWSLLRRGLLSGLGIALAEGAYFICNYGKSRSGFGRADCFRKGVAGENIGL